MITARLQGGLGNQMFQAAMGYAQAKRLGVELQLDISLLQSGRRKYQLDQWHRFCPLSRAHNPHAGEFTTVTGRTPTINESGMPYNRTLVDQIKDGDVLNGYWQTEKYFRHIGDEIRGIFYPRGDNSSKAYQWIKLIKENNSVMVHIRRGDYLIEPYHSFHGVLPISYYKSAMTYVREHTQTPKFFIFSDDLAWARANFTESDVSIVDVNLEAHAIHLMSLCPHSIIANSSFSWWGAWLGHGKENGIHIAPKQWFSQSKENIQDIVPEFWETIDVVRPVTKTQSNPRILFAVNSWDHDAKRGCHQAIRETWGKDVAPADLRFFVPRTQNHCLLADEVFVDVPRDYDYVSREILEILRWSLQERYDFTVLVSNDVFVLPQKILKCGFETSDYSGFFHEPNVPLGSVIPYPYKCMFNTAEGYGIERNLYNWADGGDGRIFSRKAAEAIVQNSEAAAYWFAADDIFIGQVLGPLIQLGEISAWSMGLHKDAAIPDNGMTWHYKNYAEHKNIPYDPKAEWLKKMYVLHNK